MVQDVGLGQHGPTQQDAVVQQLRVQGRELIPEVPTQYTPSAVGHELPVHGVTWGVEVDATFELAVAEALPNS